MDLRNLIDEDEKDLESIRKSPGSQKTEKARSLKSGRASQSLHDSLPSHDPQPSHGPLPSNGPWTLPPEEAEKKDKGPEDSSGITGSELHWTKEQEEAFLFQNEMAEDEDEERRKAIKRRRKKKIGMSIASAAAIYFVFLIYGTAATTFEYDKKGSGKVVPVEYSVDDLESRYYYNTVLSLYLRMRTLYEQVLKLDYRVASEQEKLSVIAMEYTKLQQGGVQKLGVSIDAAYVSTDYAQVLDSMKTWVTGTLSDYCLNVSDAIIKNDETYEKEAMAGRTYLENDFRQITQNIIVIGEDIKGIDVEDLKNWSPSGYIDQEVVGIKDEKTSSGSSSSS